jgi:beta-lactamase superfamily II metal-dependent hydrolase
MNNSETAIEIECLPASYGDCVLITCYIEHSTSLKHIWRMLIDTGPDECWPTLKARLAKIEPNERGKRHIDLVIISHIDHDHIGGAHLLFSDTTLGLEFGDVWFNAKHHITRGYAEAQTLSLILGEKETLPWNRAFEGKAIETKDDGGYVEIQNAPYLPRLTILSPTHKRLEGLATVWEREVEKLKTKQSNSEEKRGRSGDFPNLSKLADNLINCDKSVTNGSCIAVLLEHRGASVLLAADAFPTVIGSALLNLIQDRKIIHPFMVDAFKLGHHGSRANLKNSLLNVVQAENYLISTDNSRFGHPDDETLAFIILYGGKHPRLWFNYKTQQNERWTTPNLCQKYDYCTIMPSDTTSGIKLKLPIKANVNIK